jgi:serine/threonine-protein kinase
MDPRVDPAPGVRIAPNLRLLRKLGQGGMGTVWHAEDSALGVDVAVKLLSPELAGDEEAVGRFTQEALAIAQLRHPHIVAVHDVGNWEGVPYIVMELLEGEDLGDRLARVRRLPIGVVTAIVVQTCEALECVHEKGIVHRDLKPGNVFLIQTGGELTVKLLDFGIAKQLDGSKSTTVSTFGAVLGTPRYMSPEQLAGSEISSTSDLFALAVVTYECLAGEPPFAGDAFTAVHESILKAAYRPVSEIDRSLPKTLDAWFARAFAVEPSKRFESAAAMAEAFLAGARGRPSIGKGLAAAPAAEPEPPPEPATLSSPPPSRGPSSGYASSPPPVTTSPASPMRPLWIGGIAVTLGAAAFYGGYRALAPPEDLYGSSTAAPATTELGAPTTAKADLPGVDEGPSSAPPMIELDDPASSPAQPADTAPAPSPPAAKPIVKAPAAPVATFAPRPAPTNRTVRPRKDRGF